ncbi:hypothetical protein PISMIDRAFT_495010 [Pisolithus microcarpus 441]|uniref:Heterokaryon incompatibility domain-containing protein n=1 Tax=Pisolithus microcarpus 441 TaxID=765257 RepID=A0A0C9XGV8_9AGAM|nr:hypothetical protein PISMIDRAFT_495010 [Pisolithus microcarpus 441]
MNHIHRVYPPRSMASSDDVSYKRAILESCPPGSIGRGFALFNLVLALHNKFREGEKFGDLDEAITLLRDALRLHPSGHRDRPSSLRTLALCLMERYDSQGEVADLEESATLGREALELCLPGRPDRAVSLYNLACNLRRRFEKYARMYDLDEAIELYRAASELRPSGHPDRSVSLHWLSRCLSDRHDSQGAVADLEEAVTLGREALELCLPGHPDRAASLTNLAWDLRTRFKKYARMYDLDEAIELYRAALELYPSGHPDRSVSLHWLSRCLSDRHDSQGAVADLEEAVTLGREALELCLPGHPDRAASLTNLAWDLRTRFKKYARMYDLDEAIELHRAALELYPSGHPYRSLSLHLLSLCLLDRHDSQGAVADLEEVVTLGREALELCLPGHPGRAVSLYNLACYLRRRFQEYARMCDLDEAIELHSATLALHPSGHPKRFSSLRSLALCLSDRYDSQGAVADLEKVVTLGRAALELYPTGDPARASCLHDLAQRLAQHFRHQPIAADLDEAIALEQEALQLLTPEDPIYDVSRRCLMTYLQMKTNPPVAIMSPSALEVTHFDVNQVICCVVSEALKTMPTRLLHTHTGVLCNRDAQRSHFMDSQQYSQLLSSCSGCTPDQRTKLIHTTISGYFQFVTFSHRWGAGEPLLRDVESRSIGDMSSEGGFGKLKAFCDRACEQGYLWAWSDTCCIDKDSSAELQEAIGSMFAWYRRSALTIVYLHDVANTGSFRSSEWFTRGWTLQELLAPKTVLFYTQDWSLYKNHFGSNHKANVNVIEELKRATGIEPRFLIEFSPGMDDARSRLQWASLRHTTRPEDIAYSLFGIFNLHLPILYGESAEKALGRLLAEIITQSGDISVLDWAGEASQFHSCFPAYITSYQTPPFTLSPDTDERSLRTGWRPLLSTALRKLHRSLTELPLPQFINRRLALPSITHRVTALQPQGEDSRAPNYSYKIRASGLRPLEITLPDKLEDAAMKQGALQLVRPWHSKLLSPSAKLDATNEKRLLSMLGRPFNALLLIRLPHNEYKRIASSTLIVAEPVDSGSVLRSKGTTLNVV